MSDRPIKRSITLHGHRTSVSLEAAFWQALQDIAAAEGKPLAQIAARIDSARNPATGLATALRLFILHYYRSKVPGSEPKSE